MSSNKFLQGYLVETKKEKGIKNLRMNKPFATNTLADIGIELEIEGRNLPTQGFLDKIVAPKSKAKWETKGDGSLRGEALEYVLTTPCFSDEAEGMIKQLWEIFAKIKTTFRLSNRCSSHVHVNINGYKVNHLTSIIALWTAFEDILINYCGEERRTNHFCLASKDTSALVEGWNDSLSGEGFRQLRAENLKYLALNPRPIFDFGSVEFRCMRADKDYRPILDWVLFINAFCRFAATVYANPTRLASDLSERGGRRIFYDICDRAGVSGDFVTAVLTHTLNQDFERSVLEGFRKAQKLVLGYPWDDWMESIDEVYVPSPFKNDPEVSYPEPARINRIGDIAGIVVGRNNPWPEQAPIAPPIRAQGRRGFAERFDQYRIDPDQPIETVTGIPMQVVRVNGPHINLQAVSNAPVHFPRDNGEIRDLRLTWSYDIETGWWGGDPTAGRVRNVGSRPHTLARDIVFEREIDEDIFVELDDGEDM